MAGAADEPLNPIMTVLAAGCGFVARSHAGNLPHVRDMLRQAITYPGFAFVQILAACVTFQAPGYATQLYDRTATLPDDYDPGDFMQAVAMARSERFFLGVLHRKEPVSATT